MRVVNAHADRTGRKVRVAFSVIGEIDEMRRCHDLVVREGGTWVMVSLNSVGLAGVLELCRTSEVAVHAHRNGWGTLSRHPSLGWSYVAWLKIWRLAGVDHMHVSGLRTQFHERDESVIASARECLRPMFADKPCIVMPVFSSAQTARQAPDTFAALGSIDLVYAVGGGSLAHPDGAGGRCREQAASVERGGAREAARRARPRAPGARTRVAGVAQPDRASLAINAISNTTCKLSGLMERILGGSTRVFYRLQ